MMAPFSMANLRLPLQAAIALSPICLLGNMAINIHTASEDKLCQVNPHVYYGVLQKWRLIITLYRCGDA